MEVAVRRRSLRLAARVIEHRFNADTSDYDGPGLPCPCGQTARYVDRRFKSFESTLGELHLQRAYYHCSSCQKGFCPRDRALGLAGTSLSPAVTRMIGTVAAMVSFGQGSDLLGELADVHVSAKQVERTGEALGDEIDADERQHFEPPTEGLIPSTLYLGLDGTGIPMRCSEVAGRTGKQADGSAKTREGKLCTFWTAESRDKDGLPVRDQGSVTYSAAIESAATSDTDLQRSEFAERVLREATRRGLLQAPRQVALGDCAPWIWNIVTELFPRAIQIADRFHVKQHLSDVAKAIFGPTSKSAQPWAQQRHTELDEGRLDDILIALASHASACEQARQCVDYFQRNRYRMRYPEFHAQTLCTSSGVVEAGCKVAIGTRLKQTGMHWTVPGANAIIALRCCKLSGRFEDFWERRSSRLKAA